MSNIVKWAAVSDEETFAKVRVEFSFGDGSNGVQGVQTRLKRKDRFESK